MSKAAYFYALQHSGNVGRRTKRWSDFLIQLKIFTNYTKEYSTKNVSKKKFEQNVCYCEQVNNKFQLKGPKNANTLRLAE